ncbi:MAG: hypothetical protein ACQXXH_04695 [Candidatus Bathyarchaeia archaeon]|nr:hypothetical protein [Candidatus Bathyarchaeota archaeon A05DMB-4]MDH7595034.1 hypothetical protein [Candidatus Bathyarchaeota archaeon]
MDLGKLEKVMVLVVIGVFIVSSVNSLSGLGDPITREEAIEISKNSELVKEGLAVAHRFTIETNYYNSSRLEQLRKWHSDEIFKNVPRDAFWEEKVPEGHSVWEVIWWFRYGVGGYNVIVIVDAETGTIIHETKGIGFG